MEQSWIKTSPSFKATVIGKLLGDGSITIQEGRKPRFQFTHTFTDYNWSNYCYEHLVKYLPLNCPKYKKTMDTRRKQGYSEAFYVQSKTSDIITYLRDQWYSSSCKKIPYDLLSNHFNEESLAWWYMDDGHLKLDGRTAKKIILSTESFTNYENDWLISFLKKKYNLTFHRDNQNRIILYDQFQINYFLYLVTPYLHVSMHRKYIKSWNYTFNLPARRTTVYLPSTIKINTPTYEINMVLKELNNIITCYKNGDFYSNFLTTLCRHSDYQTKGYQIIINKQNLNNLHFLNEVTGLTYSKLTKLCFM